MHKDLLRMYLNLKKPFFKYYISGSFLLSDNCDFKGGNTIYFYPDVRSAIIGTFDDKSQLKSGHVTELIGVDKDAAFNPEPVFLGPNTEVGSVISIVFFSVNNTKI